MAANKKFLNKAYIFSVLGVIMMFFYSGFQNDHLNILRPVALDVFGFNETAADMPVTIAALRSLCFT